MDLINEFINIYDKAVWQIDGGVPSELVENHIKIVFAWLGKNDLLSEMGKEELDKLYKEYKNN